ncbi:ent-kaurenoic acid oxidase 1-like [Phragmites australis]|uniref:ent-kaurenoic acid oxidase 1-like n=1 Tax=Phragmites australis TaxID=29695 RepID=UPI002D787A3E|nr:ent-kaurenoic acid oxidase 1-like [Phragmites australis]
METMLAGDQQPAAWACWWLGLCLLPLLALAVWHGNDACYCTAFALKRWRRRGHRARLPPGHMGLPFVGESPSLKRYFRHARRPDGFVHDKKQRYGAGGVYRTHLFGSPAVLVCSPAANKLVLQSPESFSVRWPAPELVGASSILSVEGARHARLRACVIAAVNQPSSLRSIARAVQPRVVTALRAWAQKGTITAATEAKKVTFENICEMFVSMEPSPLTEEMDAWFSGLLGGLRAFPLDLPGTAFRRARRCRNKLSAVFRDELQRRKNAAAAGKPRDLMSALMQTEDEHGRLLSDEEVIDNIVSLVLAGYESTSSALMWAAYHLARSPHALAKLREENAAISKQKHGEFITPDDIPKMKYTAKVVEETLRVANIAAMVHRVALRDVEYAGYTIPQGWRVIVWLRSLHTDPNYYDDPLSFNPDRWERSAKPGTYQVFGGGHRICAGNMLARLQLSIMLHHLSVGYKWELINPDAEIIYVPHSKPSDGAVMAISEL